MNTCKRCGYSWNSKIEKPKQCPMCKSMKWDSYRAGDEPGAESDSASYKVARAELVIPDNYDARSYRDAIERGEIDSYQLLATYVRKK